MNALSGAEAFVRMLQLHGVRHIFGLCGDTSPGFGERYFSVDFGRTDHAAVAAAFGVKSWRVEDPAALRPILRQAIAAGEPTLVDVVCQPLHEAQAPVSEWVA